MNEEELVRMAVNTMTRHYWAYFRGSGRQEECEDAAQDVAMNFLMRWRQGNVEFPKGYLMGIIHHQIAHIIDARVARRRRIAEEHEVATYASYSMNLDEEADWRVREKRVQEALESLRPAQRRAVEVTMDGLKPAQAWRAAGFSSKHAFSCAKHRGILDLRELLTESMVA